jgi:hypothetical protein
MKPNRPKKSLQLDRITLRILETSDLPAIVAGRVGSKPDSICTTDTERAL